MWQYKIEIATLIIRLFVGILFFFQGYDKVFRIKIKGVIENFSEDAQQLRVPSYLVTAIAFYTSYTELWGGLFLAFGWFTNFTLLALGIDLLMVCFAFSLMRPMWDMQYVFPRLILVCTLLFLPDNFNKISIDYFLTKL